MVARQLQRYEALPRDLDALHALQWPGLIDVEGKFRFVDGVACVGNWGKHAGKPMAKVAPPMITAARGRAACRRGRVFA